MPALLAFLIASILYILPLTAFAGPPFITDDPEPVEYRHWEVYLASQFTREQGAWSGTAPHIEVNYGVLPNTQIHLIAPMAIALPRDGGAQYGYGDTEIGIKYRFVQEGKWMPMAGTFPLFEVPTGDEDRGLGSGHFQVFLPAWLQKSIGPWTTYGGGGYFINPGREKKDWWLIGWLVQRQVLENLVVGAEIFHQTAQEVSGNSETGFNIGMVYDFNDIQHLLFSAGSRLQGHGGEQFYIAYQLTFGPPESARSVEIVPHSPLSVFGVR